MLFRSDTNKCTFTLFSVYHSFQPGFLHLFSLARTRPRPHEYHNQSNCNSTFSEERISIFRPIDFAFPVAGRTRLIKPTTMRILQIRQILVIFAVLFVLTDTAEAYRGAHRHRLARRRHRPGGRHGRAAFNPYPGQVKPERMIAHKIVQVSSKYDGRG